MIYNALFFNFLILIVRFYWYDCSTYATVQFLAVLFTALYLFHGIIALYHAHLARKKKDWEKAGPALVYILVYLLLILIPFDSIRIQYEFALQKDSLETMIYYYSQNREKIFFDDTHNMYYMNIKYRHTVIDNNDTYFSGDPLIMRVYISPQNTDKLFFQRFKKFNGQSMGFLYSPNEQCSDFSDFPYNFKKIIPLDTHWSFAITATDK